MPYTRNRLVVLGLDGLPLSLAHALCDQGHLPNLARIVRQPGTHAIRAELPELSPVNWTSFATGRGPESHGVFGFTRMDPRTYQMAITDADLVAGPTIFDLLGERGLVAHVVNLPNSYPAQPMLASGPRAPITHKGCLVAGFVAPELSRAARPPAFAAHLAQAGYVLEADTVRGADDFAFLLGELRTTLASRRMALDMLWPDPAWDLFTFVLTETDRLFHFHFPALTDPDDPLHAPCLAFLAEWDALIGEVLDRFDALPGPKRLLALADHGFTSVKTEVDVNRWLMEHGFLDLIPLPSGQAPGPLDLARVAPTSRALALDPGRIYIHSSDRFARGPVPPDQVRGLARDIAEGLLGLTWNGERVMDAVFNGDDLYAGPLRDIAPDLVCLGRPGFDMKAKFDRDEIFGLFGRRGMHTADDVFFHDSAQGFDVTRVRDVGRAVLDHFGLHILEDVPTDTPAGTGSTLFT